MVNVKAYIHSLKGPILVTGASGFVGANLFHLLKTYRDDVFACVHREKGWRLNEVSDKQIIAVDFNEIASIKNLVHFIAPGTVFHCIAYGAYSFERDPNLIYQTNFQSLVNFVELLDQSKLSAFIHAGSSSEYGTNCSGPSEDSPCNPNSSYSVSKLASSNYLRFKGKQQGFPCINLRLYSVYGPLEDSSRLMPTLLKEATNGNLPPLVNPNTTRDFVYVSDVCMAFIMAAAKIHPEIYGDDFNIGSGTKTTIEDLINLTTNLFNISAIPKYGEMENRLWDEKDWYSNSEKALNLLGWKSKVDLSSGLLKMSQWVQNQTHLHDKVHSKKYLSSKSKSISAIIACYKDNQAIPVMYERLTSVLTQLSIDYEIIFVNDGSPDNSNEIIKQISKNDSRVIGINHSRNFGSQMAFRSGMELSTKDGVVLLDGDLQDPPELIAQFYEKWTQGFDVVYGIRVKRDMNYFWSYFYKLFYRIFAFFSYIKIPLDAGDFSLMDKRVVTWILNCPERDLFVRGLRAYIGFNQTGVDYIRPERMFGVSTNNFLKNIEWAKKGIFSFSNSPLTMLTTTGIFMLLGSIFLAIVVGALRLLIPDIAPKGITTVLIAILIFGSFNIFAVGLVGEYVAKIMTEVKGRPRLIRSSIVRNGEATELLPDGKY